MHKRDGEINYPWSTFSESQQLKEDPMALGFASGQHLIGTKKGLSSFKTDVSMFPILPIVIVFKADLGRPLLLDMLPGCFPLYSTPLTTPIFLFLFSLKSSSIHLYKIN